jgi:hypothetical protein
MNDTSRSCEQVLERLQQNHLKINLEKCIFGNKEVSYLGFTLTPEGIKPGKNKLKVIDTAKAPSESRQSDHSWASVISSGPTSKTLQSLPLLCSNSPGRIPDTKEDPYQKPPWMHS